MLLEKKVAIVTGGSRGIGRAIAIACAREGADVVVNYWGDNDASYGRRSAIDDVVGAIVATSSISALVGGGMQTHYTPTKAGVHSLMQSCAIALGPYGIRCNSVMPGTIATDLNADDLADGQKCAYFERRIPLGRSGVPDEVADCVAFLASDLARYVTGAALLVEGGLFVNLQ